MTRCISHTRQLTCILRRRMIPESSMARVRVRTCRGLSRFPGDGAGTGLPLSRGFSMSLDVSERPQHRLKSPEGGGGKRKNKTARISGWSPRRSSPRVLCSWWWSEGGVGGQRRSAVRLRCCKIVGHRCWFDPSRHPSEEAGREQRVEAAAPRWELLNKLRL